ncbi:RodZ domain-containing protein [Actinomadura rudentiformis]|uniref:RodZ domain-containing protein n=1 Tax=Actinomadura rudentiformis TaxID=359158 RepID=UPI001CEF6499|nr:RodZ domain-containing protein [Actinomadura rudentiformis]
MGGISLVNALTSDSKQPGPTGTASESTGGTRTGSAPSSRPPRSATASAGPSVVIRVTGSPTTVTVTVAGTGQVLHTGLLDTGEARQYDQSPLNVVAADAGSVEVTIYGQLQPRGQVGQRGEWTVPER